MTGYEKIAVLLTELGSEASEKILSILKLSPAEMNKISKNILSLGAYNPRNLFHVQRETAVLEEVKRLNCAEFTVKSLRKTADSSWLTIKSKLSKTKFQKPRKMSQMFSGVGSTNKLFLQNSARVCDGEQANTDITEDCKPHVSDSDCTQNHDCDFYSD